MTQLKLSRRPEGKTLTIMETIGGSGGHFPPATHFKKAEKSGTSPNHEASPRLQRRIVKKDTARRGLRALPFVPFCGETTPDDLRGLFYGYHRTSLSASFWAF
jgi:hypothetical protein